MNLMQYEGISDLSDRSLGRITSCDLQQKLELIHSKPWLWNSHVQELQNIATNRSFQHHNFHQNHFSHDHHHGYEYAYDYD